MQYLFIFALLAALLTPDMEAGRKTAIPRIKLLNWRQLQAPILMGKTTEEVCDRQQAINRDKGFEIWPGDLRSPEILQFVSSFLSRCKDAKLAEISQAFMGLPLVDPTFAVATNDEKFASISYDGRLAAVVHLPDDLSGHKAAFELKHLSTSRYDFARHYDPFLKKGDVENIFIEIDKGLKPNQQEREELRRRHEDTPTTWGDVLVKHIPIFAEYGGLALANYTFHNQLPDLNQQNLNLDDRFLEFCRVMERHFGSALEVNSILLHCLRNQADFMDYLLLNRSGGLLGAEYKPLNDYRLNLRFARNILAAQNNGTQMEADLVHESDQRLNADLWPEAPDAILKHLQSTAAFAFTEWDQGSGEVGDFQKLIALLMVAEEYSPRLNEILATIHNCGMYAPEEDWDTIHDRLSDAQTVDLVGASDKLSSARFLSEKFANNELDNPLDIAPPEWMVGFKFTADDFLYDLNGDTVLDRQEEVVINAPIGKAVENIVHNHVCYKAKLFNIPAGLYVEHYNASAANIEAFLDEIITQHGAQHATAQVLADALEAAENTGLCVFEDIFDQPTLLKARSLITDQNALAPVYGWQRNQTLPEDKLSALAANALARNNGRRMCADFDSMLELETLDRGHYMQALANQFTLELSSWDMQ